MPTIKIEPDLELTRAIDVRAAQNLRTPEKEIIACLRQFLGLSFPIDLEAVKQAAEKFAEDRNSISRKAGKP